MQEFPSMAFGMVPMAGQEYDPEIPMTNYGYDAPVNIGLMLLGHYYGGGSFSKAICITAGCGEDAHIPRKETVKCDLFALIREQVEAQ
jgi:hypothetical protein